MPRFAENPCGPILDSRDGRLDFGGVIERSGASARPGIDGRTPDGMPETYNPMRRVFVFVIWRRIDPTPWGSAGDANRILEIAKINLHREFNSEVQLIESD